MTGGGLALEPCTGTKPSDRHHEDDRGDEHEEVQDQTSHP
jgi:hypothetical protein